MAKIKVVTIEVERIVVDKQAGVELSLTRKEAEVLLRVLGCVGGVGNGRKEVNAIHDALVSKVARNEQIHISEYLSINDEN